MGSGVSAATRGRQTLGAALRELGAVVGVLLLSAFLLGATGIGCPVRFVTGVPCPGCGLTRAWLALLSGEPRVALAFHPLFWAAPIAVGLAVLSGATPSGRVRRLALVVCALLVAAFLVVWALRLVDPADTGHLAGVASGRFVLADPHVPGDVIHVEPSRAIGLTLGLLP